MDYIVSFPCYMMLVYQEINIGYFEQFLNTFGNRRNIKSYIEWKRKDGTWGDHVEIQAIIEIYSRGLEIYGYSLTPIRTFSKTDNPMRIQFENSNHYNSIKLRDKLDEGYTSEEFGVIEKRAIQLAKQ